MKTHLGWFCVAVAALFVGMQFGKRERYVAENAPEAQKKIAIEASENRQSAASREQPPSDSTAAQEQLSAALMARVNLLRDLKKRQLATIRLPFVYNNGKLSEGFAELFALTPSETETLRHAVENAQVEIGRLSLANAKVTHEGNSTIVTVQPFDGGADPYDRLMDSFERTLGPDRYAAMIELHTDELPRVFSGFGAEQRKITITPIPASNGHFRIQDSRKTASGSIGRTTEISNPSELSDFYRWLAPIFQQVPRSPSPPQGR